MKSLPVKLGVILIGLAIFGYTEACNAEGAWVLWERDNFNLTSWHMIGAYPSYDACIGYEELICLKEVQNFSVPKDVDKEVMNRGSCWPNKYGGHHYDITTKKGIHPFLVYITEWRCFPESVGPRK